jgi:hypothetical protein
MLVRTVLVALLLALQPTFASAGCTATVSCNNACSAYLECPPHTNNCTYSCSAPSTSTTCSGTASCTVGTLSVTCDGTTYSCPTESRCVTGYTWIKCANVTKTCSGPCPF